MLCAAQLFLSYILGVHETAINSFGKSVIESRIACEHYAIYANEKINILSVIKPTKSTLRTRSKANQSHEQYNGILSD